MDFWDRLTGRTQREADAQIAALSEQVATLQEALPNLYDPDLNLPASGGGSRYFRRLTATQRDLEPLKQETAQNLSYWLWENNPFAKRIVNLTVDYCLGEGIVIQAQHKDESEQEAMQQVIDAFWHDPINRLDLKCFDKVRELGLYGEQCYTVTVNETDGGVRLGYIDPSIIAMVITDPRNAEIPVAVKIKAGINDFRYYRVVHVDERPESEQYGRLVGVEDIPVDFADPSRASESEIRWEGSCFYFAVNKVSNSNRGRPDLLTVIDWVDALDQFLIGEMDRSIATRTYLWDVTVQGDETTVARYASANAQMPNPGSIRFHNDRVEWRAEAPDLKANDSQIMADLITGYISAGVGLAKTWLQATDDVNKSTAQELGEPTFKTLTARQRYVKHMFEQIIMFVLDRAEGAGRLATRATVDGRARLPEQWPVQVQMPELRPRDWNATATTFSALMDGLIKARSQMLVDEQTARALAVMACGLLGVEVDLDDLTERLEKEQQEKDAETALAPYAFGGNGNGNGRAGPGAGSDERAAPGGTDANRGARSESGGVAGLRQNGGRDLSRSDRGAR